NKPEGERKEHKKCRIHGAEVAGRKLNSFSPLPRGSLDLKMTIQTICVLAVACASLASGSRANEVSQDYPVSELYVMAAGAASFQGDKLILAEINPSVIWFTDRPVRKSGRANVQVFIGNWPKGTDSFSVDPPNAAVVGRSDDGEFEITLELLEPSWVGGKLVFPVLALSDQLPTALDLVDAHIFIDNAGNPSWCGHECFVPVLPIGNRPPGAVR
ncbi:MAG: hypothetical protein MI725_00915, partial [Pirellulales bacterium]|nr:hypothetical protein [Pirellulales bacterium]